MTGGQDQGFSINYWRLSYRRKFIRTLWMMAIGIPILIAFQINGLLTVPLRSALGLHAEWSGWAAIAVCIVIGIGQTWYTWSRWQSGGRDAG